MKKHISGRKVGFVILAVLFVLSIADIILRGAILKEEMLGLANVGEPLITALISALLMIFILAKKHRVFYILCGAWLGYFVLNQLFGVPALLIDFISFLEFGQGNYFASVAVAFNILSVIGIVAIGGLIVKYMNNGTICNKVFNILCIITILMFTSLIASNIFGVVTQHQNYAVVFSAVFAILNNLSRMAMLFLFAFFAYDTAKAHLARTKLDK